jgi:hypothetical protein
MLAATASAVSFTALAVKGELLARDLWVYKNCPSHGIRWAPRLGLAAVVWRSIALHERCLAAVARVPGFSVVTTVPSANALLRIMAVSRSTSGEAPRQLPRRNTAEPWEAIHAGAPG